MSEPKFDIGEIVTLNKPSSERHGEDCEVVGPLQGGKTVEESTMTSDEEIRGYYPIQFGGEDFRRFALPSELKRKPPFQLPESVTREQEETV